MGGLNIAVCVKPVPDSEHYDKITIDPVSKTLTRTGIPTVINELDKHAVEAALALKGKFGGKVTVFSMAPDNAREKLVEVLAMGADEAYLISDRAFAGADTHATSYTLASAINKASAKMAGSFDVILTGNESADGGTAQVASQLGEWLNVPHLMNVCSMEYDGEKVLARTKIENGTMEYEVKLPALFGVTRETNKPRLTNVMGMLKAKNKPITILRVDDLDIDKSLIGLVGSPTQPGEIYVPKLERKAKVITGTPEEIAEQIIAEIKKAGISVVN